MGKSNLIKFGKKDKETEEKKAVELNNLVSKAEEAANECLKHESFKRYRDNYLVVREHLLGEILKVPLELPDGQYATAIRKLVMRINTLGVFLKDVENEANRNTNLAKKAKVVNAKRQKSS